jgi:hypothetical protein
MDILAYDLLVRRLTAATSSSATVAATTRFGFVYQIDSFLTDCAEAGLNYDWLFFMFYSDVGGVGFVLVATVQ